jgi:hypothetical protein
MYRLSSECHKAMQSLEWLVNRYGRTAPIKSPEVLETIHEENVPADTKLKKDIKLVSQTKGKKAEVKSTPLKKVAMKKPEAKKAKPKRA